MDNKVRQPDRQHPGWKNKERCDEAAAWREIAKNWVRRKAQLKYGIGFAMTFVAIAIPLFFVVPESHFQPIFVSVLTIIILQPFKGIFENWYGSMIQRGDNRVDSAIIRQIEDGEEIPF
ncbi:MAG: hypothetical protein AAGB48_00075 [Planctomycetota bacterium]